MDQPRLGKIQEQKARSKAQIRKLENPQTAEFCEHTHLLDPAIELFTHRPRMHASLVESCARWGPVADLLLARAKRADF